MVGFTPEMANRWYCSSGLDRAPHLYFIVVGGRLGNLYGRIASALLGFSGALLFDLQVRSEMGGCNLPLCCELIIFGL
jgi:hypothetical protein